VKIIHFRRDRVKEFREELIKGIIEVAQNTGVSVNQCIHEAKKMLREQMKEYYKQELEKQLFKGW
jgi:hypothetical protein